MIFESVVDRFKLLLSNFLTENYKMALDDNILDAGQFRGNQENFQPIPEDYLVHNGVRLANYLLYYFVRLGFVISLSGIYEFYNDFLTYICGKKSYHIDHT